MKEYQFKTHQKRSKQRDLTSNLAECIHFDGELCYYHINTPDPNFPLAARSAFVCPEKGRYHRHYCQLKRPKR